MNVCNQDGFRAALADFRKDLRSLDIRDRQANNLAASRLHLVDLLDGLLHLARVGLGHGLHGDGCVPTNRQTPDLHGARLPPRREKLLVTEIHRGT